jgi:hypothetical protein
MTESGGHAALSLWLAPAATPIAMARRVATAVSNVIDGAIARLLTDG